MHISDHEIREAGGGCSPVVARSVTQTNRTLEYFIRALVLLTVALACLQVTGRLDINAAISPSDIQPIEGNSYNVSPYSPAVRWLGPWLYPGDTLNAPNRSTLRLLESGVPLQRPHSLHQDISKLGNGRFSFIGMRTCCFQALTTPIRAATLAFIR